MITIMPESTDQMLAVQATGTLTDEDYQEVWIPALEKIIDEFEVANALLYMDEGFEGWDLKAMWDDAKFGIKHRNHFSRIAIVGGPAWVQWGAKVGEMLMDCKVETFEPEKLQEALAWAADVAKCVCKECGE